MFYYIVKVSDFNGFPPPISIKGSFSSANFVEDDVEYLLLKCDVEQLPKPAKLMQITKDKAIDKMGASTISELTWS